MKKTKSRISLVLLVLAALTMSGCATTEQIEALQVDALRADVQTALDRATAAEAAANRAQQSADAALAAAQRAEAAAQDAKAAAEATDEKVERMFKQAMNK